LQRGSPICVEFEEFKTFEPNRRASDHTKVTRKYRMSLTGSEKFS